MKKDVIYIDTDDDITAIIGKIKDCKERVVALVPPKRIGILQSAVNLRLLSRMAETSNKKLVIITTNKSLIALSATVMVPISKNLQSKPELISSEETESDEADDVIDGSEMPIGDLLKATGSNVAKTAEDAIDTIDIDDFESSKVKNDKKTQKSDSVKIPDFKSFRKKLFIGLFLLVAISIFTLWATKFAPFATVIVTTSTSSAPISATVKLGGTESTDVSKNIVQTITKQIKKDLSIEFAATGTKDNGTKASGTVRLSIEKMTAKKSTIEAGEKIKFGDKIFIVQNDIIIIGEVDGAGSGSGIVFAEDNGESFNVLPKKPCSVVGNPNVVCNSDRGMDGGKTDIVTIVTAADVQKAAQVIVDMPTVAEKSQLMKQFTNGEKVILDSFVVDRSEAVPSPAVGEIVTDKAKLTSATNYSLTAIAKSELQVFLRESVAKQITDPKTQRVYDDGSKNVVLSGYLKTDLATTVNVATSGKIGPSIDEEYIYKTVKGKRFGDIQSVLSRVDGVSDVEVKFSYFWVSTVPTDKKKVNIKLVSENAKS